MLAIDSSSMIAFLNGDSGPDVDKLDWALENSLAVLPPVVLCELLSDPDLNDDVREIFKSLPTLELQDGYWERTGDLRSRVLKKGKRARLADSLIAQSCIDYEIPIISRDLDFRHFASESTLELV